MMVMTLLRAGTSTTYECPSYDDIAQSSVSPSEGFKIQDIESTWFLRATTEPTTRFCLCNFMNFSIGSTTYRYTDTCYEDVAKKKTWMNVTMSIGGYLSTDSQRPGMLREGFEVWNRTIFPKPNMLFNVTRNAATGDLSVMRFYACLGKIEPFAKNEMFSYLLYTRNLDDFDDEDVREFVRADSTLGVFDLRNVVYTNRTQWGECGYDI